MVKLVPSILYLFAILQNNSLKVLNKLFKYDQLIFLWRFAVWKSKSVKLGKNVKFFKGVVIHAPKYVSIGQNTGIGDYVQMWGGGGIKIGKDVLIATHSVITSQGHDVNAELYRLSSVMKKVVIEDNVWIGAGVLVMPGVTIGKNSIIGAGSVVTKNISENSVAFGAPAKVVNIKQ